MHELDHYNMYNDSTCSSSNTYKRKMISMKVIIMNSMINNITFLLICPKFCYTLLILLQTESFLIFSPFQRNTENNINNNITHIMKHSVLLPVSRSKLAFWQFLSLSDFRYPNIPKTNSIIYVNISTTVKLYQYPCQCSKRWPHVPSPTVEPEPLGHR